MTGPSQKDVLEFVKGMLAIGIVVALIGCDSKTPTASQDNTDGGPPTSFVDNITAQQIFSQMVKTYRNADGYSDRAVLYMSYRMNGRRIQEPQPWAIALDSKGRFSADLFNSQIRCDGKLFSCYVYDIESGNLDNQRVVLPVKDRLPIKEIYNDEIARHFISGYAEMPLDESRKDLQPELVPPTIGLLTGDVAPKWLKPSVRLERYEDSNVDGRDCFVVRCFQSGNIDDHVDLWIDKESSIVWQASLPTSCLDAKVRNSSEIVDLRMVARFHEANFKPTYSADQFALKPRSDATPVSRFIKVPEPLLSESIGMKAPEFEFKTQSGKPIKSNDLAGRPTALLWIAGDVTDAVNQLDFLKRSLPENFATVAAVYSDRDLAHEESGSLAMNMQLNEIARKTKINFLFDKAMTASTLLGVQAVPSVLVLDKNMKVQYTTALTKGWENETKVAIERVATGEDVASEMLADYQNFLEAYHQKLLTVSSSSLLDGRTDDSNFKFAADAKATGRISPMQTWTNSQFKMPGNIVVVPNGNRPRVFVFDGWRSIVEMDIDGKIVDRQELDLPDNEGVSVLRVATDKKNQPMFAAFMPQGKQVHVFDGSWKNVMSFSLKGNSSINDVEYSIGTALLVAADDGLHLVDVETNTAEKIDATNFDALSQPMFNIAKGELRNPENGAAFDALKPWQLTRVAHSRKHGTVSLGTAKDGGWFAVNLDDQKLGWSVSIGPQFFDKTIEPIAVTPEKNGVWAIANSDNGVHLLAEDGTWLGDFQSEAEINGVNLVKTNGQLRLLLSTKTGVANWNIDVKGPKARAASHRN